MQNAAFSALGIDGRYVVREVTADQLPAMIPEIIADKQILGANVTIPYKETVIPLLDELDPVAARIGAVNTISRQGERLKGWNTDVEGFRRALGERGYVVEGKRVALLGAGGVARAIAAALQPLAGRIVIIARNREQAVRLCADLHLEHAQPVEMREMNKAIANADLIINATPADLLTAVSLQPDQRFFDVRSRKSAEGRAMLLHQGAASFEIWTGQQAPLNAMRAALDRAAEAVLV
jgi:shikimate dehydrogenase